MVVLQLFNREKKAFKTFSDVNAQHMDAYKDAIMAHAIYYPVVEILSAAAIACGIWIGGVGEVRALTPSTLPGELPAGRLIHPQIRPSARYLGGLDGVRPMCVLVF